MNFIFRAVVIHRKDLLETQQLLLDASSNGALLSSEEHVAFLNAKNFPKNFSHYAGEVFFVFNLCIYLHQQSCLEEQINQNIIMFRSNGLLDSWVKEVVDKSYLKERKTKEPKVLVNEQLFGAYELLAIGLVLGASAFIVELCSTQFPNLKRFV